MAKGFLDSINYLIFTPEERELIGRLVWSCKKPTDISDEYLLRELGTVKSVKNFREKLDEIKPK